MKKIIKNIKKIPLFPFYLKKSYFIDFYAAYLPDSYVNSNNKSTFLEKPIKKRLSYWWAT